MAVAEILTTEKERFIVLENGNILMSKGEFSPSKPLLVDPYDKPQKPKEGPKDIIERNIWGGIIYWENESIHRWRLECEYYK